MVFHMEIFLCRHGETEHNNNGIVQGQMQGVKLNQTGRNQAKKLSERFENKNVDGFYSSSLERAIQTASIVAKPHEKEVEKSCLLDEVNRSKFEGEKFEDMVEAIKKSESASHKWSPEGGETLIELQNRGLNFLEKLKQKHHEDDTIVIIAHGGLNCSVILGVLGHSAKNCYLIHQDNCCVNKFRLTDRRGFEIEQVNDSSHL